MKLLNDSSTKIQHDLYIDDKQVERVLQFSYLRTCITEHK